MTSLAIIFKNGYITVFSSRVTFHLNCKTKLIGETVVSLLNRLVFGALLRMDCAVNKGTIYIYIYYTYSIIIRILHFQALISFFMIVTSDLYTILILVQGWYVQPLRVKKAFWVKKKKEYEIWWQKCTQIISYNHGGFTWSNEFLFFACLMVKALKVQCSRNNLKHHWRWRVTFGSCGELSYR